MVNLPISGRAARTEAAKLSPREYFNKGANDRGENKKPSAVLEPAPTNSRRRIAGIFLALITHSNYGRLVLANYQRHNRLAMMMIDYSKIITGLTRTVNGDYQGLVQNTGSGGFYPHCRPCSLGVSLGRCIYRRKPGTARLEVGPGRLCSPSASRDITRP